MMDLGASNVIHADAQAVDDCWNRIGVHGDKSCPLLIQHIHCRNCEVYGAAATRLLDRYALQREASPQAYHHEQGTLATRSLVIFRLAEEWLALATRCLVEVAPLQSVHSLPHQRSRALMGVANVRGALVPCLALGEMLGIDVSEVPPTSARIMPRMLILAVEGGSVVVPVEEVDGIHRIEEHQLQATLEGAHVSNRFTRSVLPFKNRSVRVLDEQLLLAAVARSLT
ncbi:chemotaxis protein CheW [Pseudomonas abieticivorans]|uniref:chemotaxis protein CheW n=1 Tax=Pseudomonas abieticivorans TaxID=2931382 RepID=UPI0020BEBD8E|nr:chemotaxis protein CheW [Pseudomonas sp. PIA16]